MAKQGWNNKTKTFIKASHSTGRVDVDPAKIEKIIQEKGVRVRVFRTLFCSNVKSIDGAEHNIDCQLCNGSGFLDVHPLDTIAAIGNQDMEKMPFVEGMVDGNSVAATFPTGVELQYFTLVQLIDFTEPFFQRIKRQEGNIDVLKYQATRINVVIQGRKEYFQDIDFKLDPNGNMLWLPNRGPNPGDIYTIHYEAAVQFRAVRAMHSNRFTQIYTKNDGGGIIYTKLPEQWLLQKEFLVKRTDRDGNEILPNLIHDKTDPDEPVDS